MATSPVNNASAYGDFAALEQLKSGARGNDPSTIRKVAQQFESLFAHMMIKSMRDAVGRDPIFGSDQAQTYQSMYDDQLSLELTKGKGLGLADMLVRQLQKSAAASGAAAAAAGSSATSSTSATAPATGATPATAAQRASFVSQVWPEAEQAAQQLGVHPLGLVAQAALESNWGQSVPRSANGGSSNNLFGIKAGSSWGGAAVTARTHEYTSGIPAPTSASFRAYANPGESFQDYVALLSTNPRFSAALGSGASVPAFASALQRAGYATDPDYANKVTAVAGEVVATLARASSQPASGPLKLADAAPITTVSRQAPGEELSHG